MNSDNGHLQRLTGDQVSRRLAAFADDGRFQESMRWLWDQAGDVIEDSSRSHFGEDAA